MDNLSLDSLQGWITPDRVDAAILMALNVLYAIVILLVALMVSGWARRKITAAGEKHARLDPTLFGFLGNLAKYAVLAMAVIFVLNRFGIQTTSLVALIGAAGLAIGLALQGTLSNLAAGVMIILFRPFRVGHYIEAGSEAGTVREISLFYTELKTYDGLQIIVPNGDIWASAITNYSVNDTRMIDLTVGVAYDADLKRAETILRRIAESDPRSLPDPAPFVKVKSLGDSSVDFVYRVWTKTSDYWVTRCEMTEAIKLEFDKAGIGIPFPTRTLVLESGAGETDEAPKPRLA